MDVRRAQPRFVTTHVCRDAIARTIVRVIVRAIAKQSAALVPGVVVAMQAVRRVGAWSRRLLVCVVSWLVCVGRMCG